MQSRIVKSKFFLIAVAVFVIIAISTLIASCKHDILNSNWGDTPQDVIKAAGKDYSANEELNALIYSNKDFMGHKVMIYYTFEVNALDEVMVIFKSGERPDLDKLPPHNGKYSTANTDGRSKLIFTNK